MTQTFQIFTDEGEARRFAAQFGVKAHVVYRGDYRRDWLVTIER